MIAIFKREFKAYFTNPLGFIILAVFYFISSHFFSTYYANGSPYVEYIVISVANLSLFIVPAITMRLFSEEKRLKTDQALLTAPVKPISIVLGKFLAAFSLYALGLLLTIVFEMIVASYIPVNVYYYIYALLGSLLFGASVIAVGMFISSLTESSMISIVFTLLVNMFLIMGMLSDAINVPAADNWLKKAFAWVVQKFILFLNTMNFTLVLDSFGNKIFVLKDIVYFISITIAFIFLTERSLEKRRWS